MKQVISVFTFGIGALLFAAFFTALKPTAVTAASGPGELSQCSAKAPPTLAYRSLILAAAFLPEVVRQK
jgi:hypothetical protein